MKNKETISSYIHALLVVFFLISFGLLYFIMPSKKISVVEKRKLASIPVFSWQKLFQGSFLDSLEISIADNFPFRENFVEFSFWMKDQRGIKNNDIAVYRPKKLIAKTKKDSLNDTTRIKNGEGDLVNNWIFICKGQALQMFGGADIAAKYYAMAINKYQEALKGTVTIYNIVIPTPTEFLLPEEYRKSTRPEKPNIDIITANLAPGIKNVDAYSEFAAHKNEYIYFRTDHHETVLGAYYAYTAFCKTAGLTAIPLKSLVKKVKKNYLGSLYCITKDSRLLENPDSVEYFIIPGNYKTYNYYKENPTVPVPSQLIVEWGWCYGVFLGGDFPLMKVETDLHNGKIAMVVKNSYGNPFAPFLVPHYEKVFIVDYRYFSLGLINFIVDNKITDLIFFNNAMLANADWHIQCINNIMYYRNIPIKIPDAPKKIDSVSKAKKDTLKTKQK